MVNTSLHSLEPVWTVQKTAPQVAPVAAPLWSVCVNMATISYQEGAIRMNLVVKISLHVGIALKKEAWHTI